LCGSFWCASAKDTRTPTLDFPLLLYVNTLYTAQAVMPLVVIGFRSSNSMWLLSRHANGMEKGDAWQPIVPFCKGTVLPCLPQWTVLAMDLACTTWTNAQMSKPCTITLLKTDFILDGAKS
jgi:hypothetical protein